MCCKTVKYYNKIKTIKRLIKYIYCTVCTYMYCTEYSMFMRVNSYEIQCWSQTKAFFYKALKWLDITNSYDLLIQFLSPATWSQQCSCKVWIFRNCRQRIDRTKPGIIFVCLYYTVEACSTFFTTLLRAIRRFLGLEYTHLFEACATLFRTGVHF